MKKKKSIFMMLLSMLVLPVALLCTACGQLDTKASCDTSGAYQTASSSNELANAIGVQDEFESEGYRLTSTIKMTISGGEEMNLSINAVYKNNELAAKITMPDIIASIQSGKMKYTDSYLYYKDGYAYADLLGEKIKYQVQIEDLFEIDSYSQFQYIAQYTSVEQILDLVKNNSNITVAKQGNNFRVELNNMEESSIYSNTYLYLNFNTENILSALQFQFKMTTSSINMNAQVTMSPFDGEIQFPNLNSYTLENI